MAEGHPSSGLHGSRGRTVTQPLGVLDADFEQHVAEAMRSHGIDVRCGVGVDGFEPGVVRTTDGPLDADLVVLGMGVEAQSRSPPQPVRIGAGGWSSSTSDRRRPSTASGRPATAPPPPPRHREAGAHRPRHVRQQAWPGRRHQHGRREARRGRPACSGDGDHQAVRPRIASPVSEPRTQSTPSSMPSPRRSTPRPSPATSPRHADDHPPRRRAQLRRVLGAQILGGPGAARRIDTIATAMAAHLDRRRRRRPRPGLRPSRSRPIVGPRGCRRPRGDEGRRTNPDLSFRCSWLGDI